MAAPNDDERLINQIRALLDLDASRALAPRSLSDHVRTLLADAMKRLSVLVSAQYAAESLNATLSSRLKEAEEENETFRLAICSGEDAPGHAASLPHAVIVGIVQDNYANLRDRAEMAEARVEVLENARLASIKALMNTDPNTLAEIDVLRILDRAALKEPTASIKPLVEG